MKIKEVRSIPLTGWTDDTGWDFKLDQTENQHTLIEVKTDEGITGIGSVYTTQAAALLDALVGDYNLTPLNLRIYNRIGNEEPA